MSGSREASVVASAGDRVVVSTGGAAFGASDAVEPGSDVLADTGSVVAADVTSCMANSVGAVGAEGAALDDTSMAAGVWLRSGAVVAGWSGSAGAAEETGCASVDDV